MTNYISGSLWIMRLGSRLGLELGFQWNIQQVWPMTSIWDEEGREEERERWREGEWCVKDGSQIFNGGNLIAIEKTKNKKGKKIR